MPVFLDAGDSYIKILTPAMAAIFEQLQAPGVF